MASIKAAILLRNHHGSALPKKVGKPNLNGFMVMPRLRDIERWMEKDAHVERLRHEVPLAEPIAVTRPSGKEKGKGAHTPGETERWTCNKCKCDDNRMTRQTSKLSEELVTQVADTELLQT